MHQKDKIWKQISMRETLRYTIIKFNRHWRIIIFFSSFRVMYLRIFKLYSSSFTYNIYKCLTSKLFVWYLKISICNKEGRVCDNVSEIIAIMKNNPRMIDVRGKTIFLTNKVSSSRWRFAIQIYLLESTTSVNDYNFFFFLIKRTSSEREVQY